MDPKFQTSFIPKKQSAPSFGGMATAKPSRGVTSLFMVLAVFIFIISVGAAGGGYVWKTYLNSSQESYKKQLADRESKFDIRTIERLKTVDIQISTARRLLQDHIAVSQIFDIIKQITVSNVQFNSMDIDVTGEQKGISLVMKGQGINLAAVAFQSDVMSQLERYGLSDTLKNPILSDPELDPNGSVSFGFSATIDPSSLSYAKMIVP